MNILLLGSGGREHALAWKLSQSPLCTHLFIAPGNAGTAQCGTNVDVYKPDDFSALKSFCIKESVALVVVGPEEPLVNGIVDDFAEDDKTRHIPVIGPSRQGALLEGSKAFAKKFMKRHAIPTANYREFDNTNYQEGIPYLQKHSLPIVLKADGLAAGKGVVICQSHIEAMAEFELMIQHSKFGEAGHRVVVEEFLTGIELSVFVLTDGENYKILPEAKDYKRVGEGDRGLNTGGMGAVSPVPFATPEFLQKVEQNIIKPTVEGIRKEKIPYRGFIFFGLISVDDEPFVIEYNCRLGDPETEVILPRLQSDLAELLLSCTNGTLANTNIVTDKRSASTIVAVSGGYPGPYEKGYKITGLDQSLPDNSIIFQAGTSLSGGDTVTSGGRVLCVTAFGQTVTEATKKARAVLEGLHFEDIYYRRDIGYEFA